MLVCPITSKAKGHPFEVPVKGKVKGVVLVDQIRSVDWRKRKAQYIEAAPDAVMSRIKRLLGLLLP